MENIKPHSDPLLPQGSMTDIPSHMIDILLNVIIDVMEAESGSIMMTGKMSDELKIESAKGLRDEIIHHARVKLGTGISGKVAMRGKPLLIEKEAKERRDSVDAIDLVKDSDDVSYIIPISLYDGTIGTVNINSVKAPPEQLEEKYELIQEIMTRFCEYLLLTDLPDPKTEPPSQLYMMNIFREYNLLREFRIVFDYIFQLITDITGIQKKGVFCLKNEESGFFDLVLGYGFETHNYRDIYEDLIPCLKAPDVDSEDNIRIFNKNDLSLTARHFQENYLILFPLAIQNDITDIKGQLVLLNDEPPERVDTQKSILKTICSIAAKIIDKSSSSRYYHDLTYTDSLTGTYNYGLWWKRLHEEYSRFTREKDMRLSLLLLDVDQLNKINQSHGYMAGDQLLRFIADKILCCVRSNDIVGRIGGEEFGVILLQSSKESASMIAQRILNAVSVIPREMNLDFKSSVTLSGGIASLPEDADTPDSLVEKAQTAMLSAKIMGGNQIKTFDTLEE